MSEPDLNFPDWRRELPTLASRMVTLREPVPEDAAAVVGVLSLADATRFGIDGGATEEAATAFIERSVRNRTAGIGFTYVISFDATIIGLIEVRQLELSFDTAEWEVTLARPARGTGAFLEAARLVGSFAFGTVGVHRLEARVPAKSGRANGALKKLGAVQEGVLRRSTRRGIEYHDQALWSILKEDWTVRWGPPSPRVH